MAVENDVIKVTLSIPLKGGEIKIESKDLREITEEKLRALPVESLTSLNSLSILRYQGSYCIVIEFMGCYYVYCF